MVGLKVTTEDGLDAKLPDSQRVMAGSAEAALAESAFTSARLSLVSTSPPLGPGHHLPPGPERAPHCCRVAQAPPPRAGDGGALSPTQRVNEVCERSVCLFVLLCIQSLGFPGSVFPAPLISYHQWTSRNCPLGLFL